MPHHDPFFLRELLGPDAHFCRRALSGEPGVSLPPLIDHHVHLHLIDDRPLGENGIAGVLDLGGDPIALARRPHNAMPTVAYAGAFLTAPGGYPSGRAWAPPSVVREVSTASTHPGVPGGAVTAVDEQVEFGASVIKVALNAAAGPVLEPHLLRAIVTASRQRGRPVVVHAEGRGMASMAIDAGVDALAHTPFSERLDEELIGRAVSAGQRWISTLDIHRDDMHAREAAAANLAAFARTGGTVLYGTDLGNGELPFGVNERELTALHTVGVSGERLIASLTDPWPRGARSPAVSTFVAGDPPTTADDVPAWLARAVVAPTEELIHDDR